MERPILHVVLYQPEIPENTGNIGRTCVAVGAKLWLVRPLGFRLDASRLRRAGLDYWQHLDWEVVDQWSSLGDRFPADRIWCFSKTASRSYTDAVYVAGDVLVFGSETQGLPPSMLAAAGPHAVRIPMRPETRSLNLACSAAVGMYEALRQLTAEASPRAGQLGAGPEEP